MAASLLVGSAALAQQGLIVEPWRRAAVPVAVPATPPRPMPASGLGQTRLAPPPAMPRVAPAASPSSPVKWSPPVVELLVDPWAEVRVAAPAARPRWVPQAPEIIDPWAGDKEPAPTPRVAVAPAAGDRSTIF
jgi:hypothetical protein